MTVYAYSENLSPIWATRPFSQKAPPGSCPCYALSNDKGSPIPNYAGVKCKAALINFTIHPTPKKDPWITKRLWYIFLCHSLTSLCLRYPKTTSLWILHRPGLSDTRQIASQILKTILHLGLQHTTSRYAVVLNTLRTGSFKLFKRPFPGV
jgi:hypothetical protein